MRKGLVLMLVLIIVTGSSQNIIHKVHNLSCYCMPERLKKPSF